MTELSLAADFPSATREQWLALVDGVLKGADFEKRLVARTYDGLRVEPLYPKADGAVTGRSQPGRWRIGQRVDHPDPAEANALALADLEGGADSLVLVTQNAPSARGFGLVLDTVADLDRALQGVMLDLIHLRVDAGARGRQMGALVLALAERRGHGPAAVSFDLGLAPIAVMAATGLLSAPWEVIAARCADTHTGLVEKGFAGRTFLADSRPFHEAGAAEAQELAATLASGLAYLRALETGGAGLDAARDTLSFLLVADADEFLTVAKLRALRRLWAQVETACGLTPKPIRLHAETAWRMTTRRDPWVNLLRTTIAAFSAGIGGADAITVLPFTAALGLPDAFARRLARNTQLILLEESHLWHVADPAAGAGGFEGLTDALCDKAWSLFQEIEGEGGIMASLASGALQGRIAATRAAREKAVATRRDPITGTSEFPNLREAPVGVLIAAPTEDGPGAQQAAAPPPPGASGPAVPAFTGLIEALADGGSMERLTAASPGAPVPTAPLPSLRTALPFERLRDRSDAHLARTGKRPQVFLATLGPISAFTARATFAKNLFEAGGIEAILGDGYPNEDAMVEAFRQQNAALACLCSSDEIYAQLAVPFAMALRKAGSAHLLLAGRPGELEPSLRQAGVETFVYAGCDTLAILAQALDRAGA